jgi:ubiquinone/menaquinone biosynthesis C-methylase UbiE
MFSKEQFSCRIDEVADVVMAQVRQNDDAFVWKNIANPDALYDMRMSAMKQFLQDYNAGKKEGRYIEGSLPHLPFEEQQFDLALSSHFLFLYSEHLDEQFHKEAIAEMLRVAKEVRIFPLVTLTGEVSPYLEAIIEYFDTKGYVCKVVKTKYEFQKGGDEMLQILRV